MKWLLCQQTKWILKNATLNTMQQEWNIQNWINENEQVLIGFVTYVCITFSRLHFQILNSDVSLLRIFVSCRSLSNKKNEPWILSHVWITCMLWVMTSICAYGIDKILFSISTNYLNSCVIFHWIRGLETKTIQVTNIFHSYINNRTAQLWAVWFEAIVTLCPVASFKRSGSNCIKITT